MCTMMRNETYQEATEMHNSDETERNNVSNKIWIVHELHNPNDSYDPFIVIIGVFSSKKEAENYIEQIDEEEMSDSITEIREYPVPWKMYITKGGD